MKSFLPLPDDYEIIEINTPKKVANKSVSEVSLRERYNLNLITIKRQFQEEVNGENRTVMKLSPKIAPIKVAVFPLMNKLGMPELAEKLVDDLRNNDVASFYDVGGSIGKRYRRQDAIGTPFCITIDHETLIDHHVTLRERDTMSQERIAIENLSELIKVKLDT